MVLWSNKNHHEELPHLGVRGAVNQNFQPVCHTNSRYLKATTEIVRNEKGMERIRCKVSADEDESLP